MEQSSEASCQVLLQTGTVSTGLDTRPQWDTWLTCPHVRKHLRDDGVRQPQTFQAQALQEPAAADDALQSGCRDGGAGQVHLHQLQTAEDRKGHVKAGVRHYKLHLQIRTLEAKS